MEIAIAVLISVVISLAISMYFHGLARDNNSMEKVRKYADKRTGDLNDLYKAIEDKFKLLITEFHTHQAQANAAIKLLKAQNEEFSNKIATFDSSINAIKKMEAEINNYSRLLNDLNDMTGKVEENLLRIQKESVIVDKISDRLNK